jgi:peroxiredoxin Q/BCP
VQALRDSAEALAPFEADVYLASLDGAEENTKFAESLQARHVVLSDPTGEAAKAYGVVGFGGRFAKRWTFYIDRDGIVRHIDKNVSTETAGQDMAKRLEALGVPRREARGAADEPRD